jgi:hypothetical protein
MRDKKILSIAMVNIASLAILTAIAVFVATKMVMLVSTGKVASPWSNLSWEVRGKSPSWYLLYMDIQPHYNVLVTVDLEIENIHKRLDNIQYDTLQPPHFLLLGYLW